MKNAFRNFLMNQTKSYIRDNDLLIALDGSNDSRYGLIKRAKKEGMLIPLKKGFYIIGKPYSKETPNLFEIAQFLYGPSHISLESALSYYQWIPEAVYTITSVTPLRANEFNTAIGSFSFSHVPIKSFYLGTGRVESKNGIFFIANPWRALADYLYVYKKSWKSLNDISMDLRIEVENFFNSDIASLLELSRFYPSLHVRKHLKLYLKELMHATK